jgi:hypothetical protein
MIDLPQGIELAKPEDINNSSELTNRINEAKINAGYTISFCRTQSFEYYAEVSIDIGKAWGLFHLLCKELLPITGVFLIGEIDEEPVMIENLNILRLLDFLEQFKFYLCHDCHIQFGLGANLYGRTCEIFVSPTKHFQIWTDEVRIFNGIMEKFSLVEKPGLQFIDEFPRITINLSYGEDFYGYNDLINFIVRELQCLSGDDQIGDDDESEW